MNCFEIIPDAGALMELCTLLLAVVAALTMVTTLVVEVVKNLFPKVPTNFVAVIVAMIITVLAAVILCNAMKISFMWYYAIGAVVLGFFVAYAAMFGFDKFKEAVSKLTNRK